MKSELEKNEKELNEKLYWFEKIIFGIEGLIAGLVMMFGFYVIMGMLYYHYHKTWMIWVTVLYLTIKINRTIRYNGLGYKIIFGFAKKNE
jgi:hypothetical protein